MLLCLLFAAGCATPSGSPAEAHSEAEAIPVSTESEIRAGNAAWRSGDADRAIVRYIGAARLDPTSEIPFLHMAGVYEARNQHDLAARAYEEAIQRAPALAQIRELLGFVLLRGGKFPEATSAFREAVLREPRRWRSHMGEGLALRAGGDFAAARLRFDKALRLETSSAELLAYSGQLWLDQGLHERALTDIRASLAIAPSAGAQMALGDGLTRSGDYAGGLESYLAVMDESSAYLRLGNQALEQADHERAIRYFQEAVRTSPVYSEAISKRLAVARERMSEARSGRSARR